MPNGKGATMSSGQVTNATAATTLVAQNLARVNLIIYNGATSSIFLNSGATTVTATNGLELKTVSYLELDSYTGPIQFIGTSASGAISYVEY